MEINPTRHGTLRRNIVSKLTAPVGAISAPELLPIPNKGPDRVFGLSRSWYYNAERQGLIQLVRLRLPGNVRGRVMINIERTRMALDKLANAAAIEDASDRAVIAGSTATQQAA